MNEAKCNAYPSSLENGSNRLKAKGSPVLSGQSNHSFPMQLHQYPPPPPPFPPPSKLQHSHRKKSRSPEKRKKKSTSYQYALHEFRQTITPGQSNDDGRTNGLDFQNDVQRVPDKRIVTRSMTITEEFTTSSGLIAPSSNTNGKSDGGNLNILNIKNKDRCEVDSVSEQAVKSLNCNRASSSSIPLEFVQTTNQQMKNYGIHNSHYYVNEPVMPDATYEEVYGDAYVGAPIKYVYPSGYQALRPRGGPWKLSFFIFFLFTFLCIFIVGHCSDQVDMSKYNVQGDDFDDDALIIETRWCGSRLLYAMWLVTVVITAMAASYCSIIGYIRLRDFSVANMRSQPPGMVGKSEYYVRIDDQKQTIGPKINCNFNNTTASSIYQSDGTPQFWGGYIYRPTQAAVAVTSR